MSNNEKEKRNQNREELGEDTTKYGEFISSYFAWLTLDRQKQNAKQMEQMTKNRHGDGDFDKKQI